MNERLFVPENKILRLATDIVIVNGNTTLLGLRTSSVGFHQWSPLGGRIECCDNSIFETALREKNEELPDVKIELIKKVVGLRLNRLPPFYQPHLTFFLLANYIGGNINAVDGEKIQVWQWFENNHLPENMFSKVDQIIKSVYDKKFRFVFDFPK